MDRLKKIRIIVTDVDGVLTDGRIRLLPSGEEMKVFHARDGAAIRIAIDSGIRVAVITGRGGQALEKRSEELGITRVIMFSRDKKQDLKHLLNEMECEPDEALFIGDDITDLDAMRSAGVSACPSDAALEVKNCADLVLKTEGGNGVIRELLEMILKIQNKWDY